MPELRQLEILSCDLPARQRTTPRAGKSQEDVSHAHPHQPGSIEQNKAQAGGAQGQVRAREREPHPGFGNATNCLLDQDDQEEGFLSLGAKDHRRVGDVPHQKQNPIALHGDFSGDAGEFEPGSVIFGPKDKGKRAGNIHREDRPDGKPGKPTGSDLVHGCIVTQSGDRNCARPIRRARVDFKKAHPPLLMIADYAVNWAEKAIEASAAVSRVAEIGQQRVMAVGTIERGGSISQMFVLTSQQPEDKLSDPEGWLP